MRRWLVLVVVVVAALGWRGFSAWRGTEVSVLAVELQPLKQLVVASGQVRNQSLARIGAEITGTVAQRHVREGDLVEAGQVLISLRRDELQAQFEQAQTALAQLSNQLYPQAQQSLQEAKLAWQQAEREAVRRENLAAQGMLSAEQAEQARHLAQTRKTALTRAELAERSLQPGGDDEQLLRQRLRNAQANLDKTLISAPFAGRVQTRNVEPGDQVQPGKVLLEIARQGGLEIVVAVDEKFIAPLALEQPAVVIADAWPEQQLPAKVSFIAPAVDENSGTLDVHLQVTDEQQLLRLGMTVSVSITTAEKAQALVVPRDYVQASRAGAQVLVLEEGRAVARKIQTGLQSSTRVEVVSGLASGELLLLPEQLPAADARLRAGKSVQLEPQE